MLIDNKSKKIGKYTPGTYIPTWTVVLILLIACVQKTPNPVSAQILRSDTSVSDVLVDGQNCRGAHISTRPHNRKVVYYTPSGTWFVFYGTGHWIDKLGDAGLEKEMITWRSSSDGKTFSSPSSAVIGNGHSSSTDVLLVGDRIYLSAARFGFWRSKKGIPAIVDGKPIWHPSRINRKKPNFYSPYELFAFDVKGRKLVPRKAAAALPGDKHIGNAGPHYGSITRDTNGHLWVAARALIQANGRLAVWVSRTARPHDISEWLPHTVLFESAGPGTLAPQILALDEGRVACILFTKYEKKTMLYLYDPDRQTWDKPHVIGRGYASKRASAVFDPGSRRLHVVYIDKVGDARHRALRTPYGTADWSPSLAEPGVLVAKKAGVNRGDDDLSLSANLSKNPAPLALVHRGTDLHLRLRYYDGGRWSPKAVRVGLQDSQMICDEASAAADFSHGLGFIYMCTFKSAKLRKKNDHIVQLRFCLVEDVPSLF